ncbi:MAG: hypothetical protein JO146_08545 [Candidatus Eremiobacteraeota bacterium]|nr:hypothetical protein [Candidatus Eremiobacteraeota bacterium]
MKRFTLFAGAALIMVVVPGVAFGAPTGGAVYRAAPVVARPAYPQRAPEQNRSDFTVPFHVDASPKTAPQTLRLPTPQIYTRHAWTWQPTYVWLANPCFANGANWAPLQSTAAAQSLPEFTIGSLAGNPSHSVLSKSASDIANLASSSSGGAESGSTGLQFQWQPSVCGQQGMF